MWPLFGRYTREARRHELYRRTVLRKSGPAIPPSPFDVPCLPRCRLRLRGEVLRLKNELEDALTERLQGEDKRLFLKFVDAYDEFLGSADLESFTCGFRLGAAFTYDTFVEKE